jgi:SAM-dependent methyltransferase
MSVNTGGNPFLTRAYASITIDDTRNLYNDWASVYNADMSSPAQDYVGPVLAAQAVVDANGNIRGEVFDAGCGTGLVGIALAKHGATTMDGVDLSPKMLEIAEETKLYRHLATADLSKDIDSPDDIYDVVVCVGTFTKAHVGPVPALKEFVRIAKKGGVIVGTVLDAIWAPDGYEAEVGRLRDDGAVEVVSAENTDYRKRAGVKARMLVMRKR